jgi:hypothetical protein
MAKVQCCFCNNSDLCFDGNGRSNFADYEKHGFKATMRAEVGVLTSNFRIMGDMEKV